MDLEKYFDTVNQSKLIEVLSRTIKDGRVISLIHKYLKARVKELTARSYGLSNLERLKKLKQYIVDWVNYFKIADMKKLLVDVDQWMRRRIRMVIWKQWKKIKTRFKNLKKLGIDEGKAWEFANTRKGYWRIAKSPILNRPITNDRLIYREYLFFSNYYKQVRVN